MTAGKARDAKRVGTWRTQLFLDRSDGLELDAVELFFDESGAGRPSEITIKAAGGLTGSEISRLPWSTWIRQADAARRYGVEHLDPFWAAANTTERRYGGRREVPRKSGQPTHPGRRGHPHDHYVQIAEHYTDLVKAGSRSPTQDIATSWGVPRDTVAGWIRTCRDRNLLPPARRGKAG